MNRNVTALAGLLVLTFPVAALAQTAPAMAQPNGPAAEVQFAYNRLKPNILKAAEKMPADQYGYKPTPEIRAFGRVVNHVTEAQFHACTALNGTAFDKASVPADDAGKDAILAGLKASFAECDKAYASLTDGTLMAVATMGPMTRTHIGMAWGNVSHDNEQYAELSTYLRLKGFVPPTSEK